MLSGSLHATAQTVSSHSHRGGITASISANPTTFVQGSQTVVTWSSHNAASATLNGVAVATSGTETIAPSASELLTLIATRSNGTTASAQVQLNVTSTKPLPTSTIAASPATIVKGKTSVLTWSSTNGTSATLNGSSVLLNGSLTVAPTATTAYKLIVTGVGGTTTSTTTVTVTSVAAAPTATMAASPTSIVSGKSSVLTWSSTNGTSATLNGSSAMLNGSLTVAPTATTAYKLIVTGAGGTATSTTTVTVTPATTAPTATIAASPTSIVSGKTSVIAWSSTNATSATLNGAAVAVSGSQTVAPTATTAYKLIATGAAGTASSTTTVTVTPAAVAPTATVTVSPTTIALGESATVTWTSTNATSATLNGAAVATSGTETITPTASEALALIATGSGGSVTSDAQLTVTAVGATSTSSPHINYTDLNVGSGTGGDTGNGVYVRIFGSNFGATKGSSTLTLGGSLVTTCSLCSWSSTAIIAQLGSAATTGNIVVTVGGVASNGIPFTVTPTTIVFVSPKGLDSNSGTFAAPFLTWRAAFNSVTGNDNQSPSQNTVIYIEPGTNVTANDGRGYSAVMSTDLGGTSVTKQLSIVGYPGGAVNIGSTSVSNGVHGWGKYITLADLNIIGQSSAIDDEAGNVRIVNNTLSCPSPQSGLGGTACILLETTTPADTWMFDGNLVNNTGGNVDKTYHAVYFGTSANHAEVGWNNVGQGFKGYCRSIFFHSTGAGNQFDIHVHDNIITGGYCDAVGLASVDPSQGTVEVYNNVIDHVAIASNPYGVANETGIAINSDPSASSSGTVAIYNNTVVDAGGYTNGNQNGCFGVVTAGAGMNLTNNICSQPSSAQPYIQSGSTNVSGSHNLWYGAGGAPSWDSAPVIASPDFISAIDFALQAASPAIGMGTATQTSVIDIVGTKRATPPAMGAYQ